MSRPFDIALALHLLDWLAGGGALATWAAGGPYDVVELDGTVRHGVMPCTPATIHKWRRVNDDFNAAYTCAQEDRAATYADEVVTIADNTEGDFKIVSGRDGVQRVEADHDSVRRAEARIKARSMALLFLAPHIYKERKAIDVTTDGQPLGGAQDDVANERVADRVIDLLHKAHARKQAALATAMLADEATGAGEGGAGGPSAGEIGIDTDDEFWK